MQPSAQQTRQPAKAPPKKAVAKARPKGKNAVAIYDPTKQPAPRSMIEVIAQAARDPSVDVKKMQELLSMQRQIEEHEAERLFNEAMKVAQEQMPKVLKDRANTVTNSRYATLEKVNDTIMPVALRLGFTLSFGTEDSHLPGHYRVTCVVGHTAGHSRKYQADVPADSVGMKGSTNKTPTHAFGSTMSYARRYLTLMIFNVVPTDKADDDGNVGAGEPITDKQYERLVAMLDEIDGDKEKFCAVMKVPSVREIPASMYERAAALIAEARMNKAKKAAKPAEVA